MKLSHQKLKMMYLAKILMEQTDEEHTITVPEMIAELSKLGISAERKVFMMTLNTYSCLDLIYVQIKHAQPTIMLQVAILNCLNSNSWLTAFRHQSSLPAKRVWSLSQRLKS